MNKKTINNLFQSQLPPHLQGLLPRWPLLPPSAALPGLNPGLFKSGELFNSLVFLIFFCFICICFNLLYFTCNSVPRICIKKTRKCFLGCQSLTGNRECGLNCQITFCTISNDLVGGDCKNGNSSN